MSDFKEMDNLQEEAKAQDTLPARLTELANISDELAEIVASNVSAPPELLKELASHHSNAVKKAVVSNPNTPTEILFKLAEHYPQEFLANPILDILFLENPNFTEEIPKQTLVVLLQQLNISDFILKSLVNHSESDTAEIARLHINYAGEMSAGWHELANDKILDLLSRDLFYNSDQTKLLSCFADFVPDCLLFFKHRNFIEKIAGNKSTSVKIIEQLAAYKYDYIDELYYRLASNPNTPKHILEKIISSYDNILHNNHLQEKSDASTSLVRRINLIVRSQDKVYLEIAKHNNTSINILEKLATQENRDIRRYVARNNNTPVKVLIKLAEDKYYKVRYAVGRNPNTPINVLNRLAKSKTKYVRIGVAKNSNIQKISFDNLEEFVNDNEDVRVAVSFARNHNTPTNFLDRLAASKNPEIRKSVATNHNTPIATLRKLANDPVEKVRLVVARNPNCPKDILERYTSEQYNLLPINIVKIPNTSSEILEQLALHNDAKIRLNIAKHPNTSVKTLEQLSSDRNIEVLEAVLNNQKCNLEIKTKIFTNLGKLHKPCLCRLTVFLTEYANSEDLVANYNSTYWLERYAIAQNKKTPKETLEILAKDCNRIVRATAKESLGNI